MSVKYFSASLIHIKSTQPEMGFPYAGKYLYVYVDNGKTTMELGIQTRPQGSELLTNIASIQIFGKYMNILLNGLNLSKDTSSDNMSNEV